MPRPALILRGRLVDRDVAIPLTEGEHVVGRGADCDVRLEEPSVSRRHARLVVSAGGAEVTDLGSSNGTLVNGRAAEGSTPVVPGDRLALGNLALTVESREGLTTRGGSALDGTLLEQTNVRAGVSLTLDEARETTADDQHKKAHLFRILAEAGELLTHPGDPDEVLDPLLGLVEKAISPERSFLLLRDGEDEEPRVVASRVKSGADGSMILSRTLVGQVLDQRTAFLTEDASQDERLAGGMSIVGAGTRSAMAAPLFDNERVIGLLYADTRDLTVTFDRDELKAFVLLANVVAVAITNARYRKVEKERQRLATELGAARQIMRRLLPRELPRIAGLDICAHLDSCEEVAGDLYDVRALPDGRALVVVGDVSGKGLPAALIVAGLLPAIRVAIVDCAELDLLAARVNDQLCEATDAVRFATLFLAVVDPAAGTIRYVNAGHNPPLLVRPDGEVEELTAAAPPVGMVPGLPFPVAEATFVPGSRLLCYSDGVTEAMDDAEDMYGEERLLAALATGRELDLKALHRHLLDDLAGFTGGAPQSDDVTLLVAQAENVAQAERTDA
jgi:serine phosphatase RsbU (regulator of sigma subunit)